MSPTPWIVVNQEGCVFECRRCGQTYQPTLPIPIPMLTGLIDGFIGIHKDCPEKKEAEGDPPASEPSEE